MIEYKTVNSNGVVGCYNLKNGQFIPECCMNCSRLANTDSPSSQKLKTCGIHIFLPVLNGSCKRQLKDQILINFKGNQ